MSQSWECALLLFAYLLKIALLKVRPWAIPSHRSFKKSEPARIALVALYKRATMRKLLLLLFLKEQHEWFAPYLLFRSTKRSIHLKNSYFSPCLWQFFTAFPLIYAQEQSLQSFFAPSLFFKEQHELFTFVALYKRVNVSKLLFCSFAQKKRIVRSKNQRANSQPWPS